MGLALQRAGFLDSAVVQLAVWDGLDAGGDAGTGADVAIWRRHGHQTVVVTPPSRAQPTAAPAEASPADSSPKRVVRAVLFGDIRGYSKLTDEQLPVFNDHVLGAFGEVLADRAAHVQFKNTWGDGIYVVLTDTASAAACALDLQRAMGSIDLAALGLPDHLALRLSGHVGPVFPVHEPVLGVDTFIGSHISRTARIEPVTPAGAVYVTEPFSASLTLNGDPHVCDYVGHRPPPRTSAGCVCTNCTPPPKPRCTNRRLTSLSDAAATVGGWDRPAPLEQRLVSIGVAASVGDAFACWRRWPCSCC